MADGGGVVESVKSTASGGGKKWILIGAVAGGLYLWWTRARTASASKPAGAADITPGGAAVAEPVTPPAGDYSPTSPAKTRPSTNAEWLTQAVDVLTQAPYNRPAIATYNALNRALAGSSLSTAEAAIVELALQVKGSPPDGMPPLTMSPPGSPTQTDPTPVALATPTGMRTTGQRKNWIAIACDAVPGATGYRFYKDSLAGYTDVQTGPAMEWWVENVAKTHKFQAAAMRGSEVSSPTAAITVNYTVK